MLDFKTNIVLSVFTDSKIDEVIKMFPKELIWRVAPS